MPVHDSILQNARVGYRPELKRNLWQNESERRRPNANSSLKFHLSSLNTVSLDRPLSIWTIPHTNEFIIFQYNLSFVL